MTTNEEVKKGRPKTLGNLAHFNTKLQEDNKLDLQAILELTDFVSYREIIESWTADYLAAHPEVAAKVKAYRELKSV